MASARAEAARQPASRRGEAGPDAGQPPTQVARFEPQPQRRDTRARGADSCGRAGAAQLMRQLRGVPAAHREPRLQAGEPAPAGQRVHGGASALQAGRARPRAAGA